MTTPEKISIRARSRAASEARLCRRRAPGMAAARIIIAGACLLLGTAASAQNRGYMRVVTPRGTMPGESTDPAHYGWIPFQYANMPSDSEIEALKLESNSDATSGTKDTKAGGNARKASDPHASAPKLVHRPVVIVKEHDRSSMALVVAQTSHQVLPEVDIVLTTKNDVPTLTYKLTDASVISIRQGGTNEGTEAPLEQVRFNYAKIEVEQ
ncbi:MAG TPA: type VI secretion system tube protein Hcp [Candidatus Acidoferrales bacterium]|nr:type VI secretion system tube protein Hcp [Candidatus Acidoferrales bacterium]